jgi:hypothetical protein
MPYVPTASFAGEDIYGCPLQQVDPAAAFYLRLYSHYKNGILWCGGGLRDQPHVYLQAMEIIDAEVHKIEAEQAGSSRSSTPYDDWQKGHGGN